MLNSNTDPFGNPFLLTLKSHPWTSGIYNLCISLNNTSIFVERCDGLARCEDHTDEKNCSACPSSLPTPCTCNQLDNYTCKGVGPTCFIEHGTMLITVKVKVRPKFLFRSNSAKICQIYKLTHVDMHNYKTTVGMISTWQLYFFL